MTFTQKAVEAALKAYRDEAKDGSFANRICMEAALTAALAVDGLSLVPKDALSVVLNAAEMYDDEGPIGEGWQSSKLEGACAKIAQIIAPQMTERERR